MCTAADGDNDDCDAVGTSVTCTVGYNGGRGRSREDCDGGSCCFRTVGISAAAAAAVVVRTGVYYLTNRTPRPVALECSVGGSLTIQKIRK